MPMPNGDYVVIDVREPYEYDHGHVAGAINIPSHSLMNGVPELSGLPKDTRLLVYCRTGSRSAIAMDIFRTLGFVNLTNGINQATVRQQFGIG